VEILHQHGDFIAGILFHECLPIFHRIGGTNSNICHGGFIRGGFDPFTNLERVLKRSRGFAPA
jgi:hypothetical protein